MIKQTISKFFFSSSSATIKSNSGNLYLWGKQTANLGYEVSKTESEVKTPRIVKEFKNNVKTVSCGYYHNMAITDTNELYTFGSNSKGQLGHNDSKNYIAPKLVEYFTKNDLKVVDAKCGQEFSIALTDDGDVWTWGFGGKNWNFFMKIFANSTGPLGHGDIVERHTPTPVEYLRQYEPVNRISCGYKFCTSINSVGDLYNWGVGEYGVFGNGSNKCHDVPFLNDYFEHLKKNEGLEIVKIKQANQYSMALMSDGNLYAWGCNEFGQMGIKNEIGIEIYETANFPMAVDTASFPKDAKIVDFALGENIVGILFDNNEVFWSGKRIAYLPERMRLPKDMKKIKLIGACHHSIQVVDEDNKIFFLGDYMTPTETDDTTGVSWVDNSIFGGGNIIAIGGKYQNRFAIVDNSVNQLNQEEQQQLKEEENNNNEKSL